MYIMHMFRMLLFNGFTENSVVSGKDSENQKFIYIFIWDYMQHFAIGEGSLRPLKDFFIPLLPYS